MCRIKMNNVWIHPFLNTVNTDPRKFRCFHLQTLGIIFVSFFYWTSVSYTTTLKKIVLFITYRVERAFINIDRAWWWRLGAALRCFGAAEPPRGRGAADDQPRAQQVNAINSCATSQATGGGGQGGGGRSTPTAIGSSFRPHTCNQQNQRTIVLAIENYPNSHTITDLLGSVWPQANDNPRTKFCVVPETIQ